MPSKRPLALLRGGPGRRLVADAIANGGERIRAGSVGEIATVPCEGGPVADDSTDIDRD